jgi:hypothetical protein
MSNLDKVIGYFLLTVLIVLGVSLVVQFTYYDIMFTDVVDSTLDKTGSFINLCNSIAFVLVITTGLLACARLIRSGRHLNLAQSFLVILILPLSTLFFLDTIDRFFSIEVLLLFYQGFLMISGFFMAIKLIRNL